MSVSRVDSIEKKIESLEAKQLTTIFYLIYFIFIIGSIQEGQVDWNCDGSFCSSAPSVRFKLGIENGRLWEYDGESLFKLYNQSLFL